VHAANGRWAQAERVAREVVPWADTAFGSQHPETAIVVRMLSEALLHQSRWKESLEQYDRYLAVGEHLDSMRDPDYAFALAQSAEPLEHLGRAAEAVERLERAVTLLPLDKGNRHRAATARFMLAQALPKSGKGRARNLALEARAELENEGRGAEVKQVDTWLEKR
jgi:tetratricopeptide (TPR) repeat protein